VRAENPNPKKLPGGKCIVISRERFGVFLVSARFVEMRIFACALEFFALDPASESRLFWSQGDAAREVFKHSSSGNNLTVQFLGKVRLVFCFQTFFLCFFSTFKTLNPKKFFFIKLRIDGFRAFSWH
jgi:hypothetical protein